MPHTDQRDYFVSIRRGDAKPRVGLLAGPFPTHTEALAMVDPARRLACQIDPWADFDYFGTMSLAAGSGRSGVLNERLRSQQQTSPKHEASR